MVRALATAWGKSTARIRAVLLLKLVSGVRVRVSVRTSAKT
jgi:hypothetical protein